MSTPLLATKLHFPQARTDLIERPRLLEQLLALQGPGRKLGLISAPAGFGKSTLVLQWLASEQSWPAGWVSLDPRDNQPAVFFTYLISALQTIVPEAGKSAMDLLPLPGVDLEEVVTRLVNDLAGPRSPFVLILDDFHNITQPAILQALEFFIEALPAQMRLLLLTREDPALQLALRRANGQLVELRQEDLRFGLAEAFDFLNQCMGLDLVASQVETLEVRTEGWIAGLQLAALSLQRSADVDRFIREFSGNNRFILDYLMEEVLSRQPSEVQDFLLQTSILEHLCAGLCAAVTRKSVGACQQLLESLVKANLFVISLDQERCWYRYHHMFRNLLLARVRGGGAEQEGELCKRASDWYEQNGDLRLAVDFAFSARDIPRAADLLEMHFGTRWHTSDLEFLFLIDRLPFEVIQDRPSLCLDSAGRWVTTGQYARMAPFLDAAERCLTHPERPLEPAEAADLVFARALRAFLGDIHNQPVEIDESFRRAFLDMPEAYPSTRQSVAMLLEAVCYMAGDFEGVLFYCKDALERDQRLNGTIGIAISVMRMAFVLRARGKLHEALDLVMEYETYVRERGSRRFYVSGVLNLLWGDILLEWNRLDEAETQIRQGLRLLEDWRIPQYLALGQGLLACLQLARGDLAEARAALRKAEALYHGGELHPSFLHPIQKAQVSLWIAERNLPALEAFAYRTAPLTGQPLSFRSEAPLIELCRTWIALGQLQEASALLNRLAASAGDRSGRRLEVLTLLVVSERNRPAVAQKSLEQALRLGEPEGYLRTFMDAGEPLRQGLDVWLQQSHTAIPASLRAYARHIASTLDQTTGKHRAAALLPEPLTEREYDVLRLVVEGCSNKQIAERLFLAEGTVKFYVHKILQKLGAESRAQAIARARALELLEL